MSLLSLHSIHWMSVLALITVLSILYRKQLAASESRYLLYWLAACIMWVGWYLLKSIHAVTMEFHPNHLIVSQRLFYDLLFNSVNTMLIVGATQALLKRKDVVGPMMNLLDVLVLIFLVIVSNLFLAGIFDILQDSLQKTEIFGLPLDRITWKWSAIVFSGLWAMGVLLRFGWIWLRCVGVAESRWARLSYWVFVSYGIIQLGYPLMAFLQDHLGDTAGVTTDVEKALFGLALLLKLLATLVVFLSYKLLPQFPASEEAAATAA